MEKDKTIPQQPKPLSSNGIPCPDSGEKFAQGVLDAAAKMGLSAATAQQVQRMLQPIAHGEVDDAVINLLALSLSRDEDLKNADAEGYRRGRNEKIDLLTRPMNALDDPDAHPSQFPRYNRRSIWDR